ncbi:MAG: GAF domain-containing protein [Gemmatimonas sp.]|nr:GAF domain-containing protein [Gemmatimonas sp.]
MIDIPVTTSSAQSDTSPSVLSLLTRFARDLAEQQLTDAQLFAHLADTARAVFAAEGTAVLRLIDAEHYEVLAPSGTTTVFDGQRLPLKPGPSFFRDAIELRRAEFTNDAVNDPRIFKFVAEPLGVRQLAVAPVLLDHVVIGLLTAVNPANAHFDEEQLSALEFLAAQGAVVMRTQRLLRQASLATAEAQRNAEDAARTARANAILAASARAFANAPTREALYTSLASVLVTELHAVGFAVYEADPRLRTARFETQWGVRNANVEAIATNFWRTALGDVVQAGEPVFISEFSHDPDNLPLHASLSEQGVLSAALLPLMIEEWPQGLLSVRFAGVHVFDDDEKRLLGDIAAQFSLAFRNTMYVDELERRADRLTVLARAQQQLTQLASEDNLPHGIAEAVEQVLPSRSCDIFTTADGELRRVVRLENGSMVSSELAPLPDLTLARMTADTGISRLACHLEAGVDAPSGIYRNLRRGALRPSQRRCHTTVGDRRPSVRRAGSRPHHDHRATRRHRRRDRTPVRAARPAAATRRGRRRSRARYARSQQRRRRCRRAAGGARSQCPVHRESHRCRPGTGRRHGVHRVQRHTRYSARTTAWWRRPAGKPSHATASRWSSRPCVSRPPPTPPRSCSNASPMNGRS